MNKRKLINLSPEKKEDLMIRYIKKQWEYQRPDHDKPVPMNRALLPLYIKNSMRYARISARFDKRLDKFIGSLTNEERFIYHDVSFRYMFDKAFNALYKLSIKEDK